MATARVFLLLSAAAVLSSIAAVACGSSEDSNPTGSTAVPTAPAAPERYVDEVCTAAARMYTTYQASFKENLASMSGMDPTDAYAKIARDPFALLIADLEKMTPPADAAAGHADTIRQAKDVLDALTRSDRQKLLALRGTPDTGKWRQVIDLSADLKTRFGPVSAGVKSCQELEASGGGNPFR
ncbi:MAG: hypothetical protein HY875_05275 [Chloroflexi bacterium]|nr:hypothetical protein [Chloroflexota bacterium]